MANKKKRSLFSRLRDNLMSEEGLKSLNNFIGAIGEYKKSQDTKDTKAFKFNSKDTPKLFKNNSSMSDLGDFRSEGINYLKSPGFKK